MDVNRDWERVGDYVEYVDEIVAQLLQYIDFLSCKKGKCSSNYLLEQTSKNGVLQ